MRLRTWYLAATALLLLAGSASAGGTGDEVLTDATGDYNPSTPPGMVDAADLVRLGVATDATNLYLYMQVAYDGVPGGPTGTPPGGATNQMAYRVGFEAAPGACTSVVPEYRGPAASPYWFGNNVYTGACAIGGAGANGLVTLPKWICNEAKITVAWTEFGAAPAAGTIIPGFTAAINDDNNAFFTFDAAAGTGSHTVGNNGKTWQDPPTGVTATATGDNDITVSWTAPVDNGAQAVRYYRVYRSIDGGPYSYLGQSMGATPSFVDAGLPVQTASSILPSYEYKVTSVNCTDLPLQSGMLVGGESLYSSVSTALAPDFRPVAPSGLIASDIQFTTITLDWTSPVDCPDPACSGSGGSGLSVQEVYRSSDPTVDTSDTLVCACAAGATQYVDNVLDGTTYYYAVRAKDNRAVAPNIGAFSAALSVTTPVSASPIAPTILTNQPMLLVAGDQKDATTAMLEAAHSGYGPASIAFTLDSIPVSGDLRLQGKVPPEMAIGDIFTQEDIDSGDLSFESDGTLVNTGFDFTVTSPDGVDATGTFTIQVVDPTPPKAVIGIAGPPYYSDLGFLVWDKSSPGDFPITVVNWEFLSGSTVLATDSGPQATFVPPGLGTYTVRLTVGDGSVSTAVAETTIEVLAPFTEADPEFLMTNDHPVVGEEVRFWDVSEPGSVALVGREWDFRDPHPPTEEASVTHVFNKPGLYTVTLRITDKTGNEFFARHDVVVSPASGDEPEEADWLEGIQPGAVGDPIADAGPDHVVLGGSIVELSGLLSRPGTGATSLDYRWEVLESGIAVPIHAADTVHPRVQLPFVDVGEMEVLLSLVVTDDRGRVSAPDVVRLLVRSDVVPSLKPIPDPTARFDYERKPTGEVGFFALDSPGTGVVYSWNMGDGTIFDTDDPHATHRYEDTGLHRVTLRVEDSFGRVAEYTQAVVFDSPQTAAPPRPEPPAGPGPWPILLLGVIFVAVAGSVTLVVFSLRSQKT